MRVDVLVGHTVRVRVDLGDQRSQRIGDVLAARDRLPQSRVGVARSAESSLLQCASQPRIFVAHGAI